MGKDLPSLKLISMNLSKYFYLSLLLKSITFSKYLMISF